MIFIFFVKKSCLINIWNRKEVDTSIPWLFDEDETNFSYLLTIRMRMNFYFEDKDEIIKLAPILHHFHAWMEEQNLWFNKMIDT